MIVVKIIFGATFAVVVAMMLAILVLVPTISAATEAERAAAGVIGVSPSEDAIADIPAILLPIYIEAARSCVGLPWTVIAGIGKVESNHGRYDGATIGIDGRIMPPIIGIALNGSNNTAVIRDTDEGRLDGDTVWDRAVGPFQFIPSSWRTFGVDGNGDGVRDPHNVFDAVPAAVRHLCPTGTITDIEATVFSYNHSTAYVDLVLEWAETYTGAVTAVPIAGYALPVIGLTEAQAIRPHHDYAAIDIGLPVGTPVFAMVDGVVTTALKSAAVFVPGSADGRCGSTITIEGVDSVRYTYCHLSAVSIAAGDQVTAGQPIGATGGQPGAPGAGNTTGPHLHLSLRGQGRALCPQPVLLSIIRSRPINPLSSPSSGCIGGQVDTDWSAWLTSTLH